MSTMDTHIGSNTSQSARNAMADYEALLLKQAEHARASKKNDGTCRKFLKSIKGTLIHNFLTRK